MQQTTCLVIGALRDKLPFAQAATSILRLSERKLRAGAHFLLLSWTARVEYQRQAAPSPGSHCLHIQPGRDIRPKERESGSIALLILYLDCLGYSPGSSS